MMRILSLALLTITMSACGGGGSVSPTPDVSTPPSSPPTVSDKTNVLLIIADDLGVDASAQYPYSDDVPNTLTLNALATNGLVFDNFWSTPTCATTRAALISGRYGVNSDVLGTPGTLDPSNETIQTYLASYPETRDYASAVFGKWHIGNASHPASVGVEEYQGNLSNLDDYYDWTLTINGAGQSSTTYNTTHITDLAINWIDGQSGPWFAWLAYSAPHSPFHLPPNHLHERNLSGTATDINNNTREYYLAAIEAMDAEIGRLLASLPDEQREKTLVVFLGDNGTGQRVIDQNVFPSPHGKGSLFEGALRAPLVVSGDGVSRIGEREDALVNVTDLFATIANVAGSSVSTIYDSVSFHAAFSDRDYQGRDYLYVSYRDADLAGWAVRDATFKLLENNGLAEEMYDVSVDIAENFNLLPGDAATDAGRQTLLQIRHDIEDHGGSGGPGSGDPIDISNAILTNRSANCADYADSYTSTATDIGNDLVFNGDLVIEVTDDRCGFSTNAIPNHDFNDRDAFPNDVLPQDDYYEITATPLSAEAPTDLSLVFDNALMLNGVKVDLLAAGCFGVGDGRIGCNNMDQPWRYDPLAPGAGFRVDSHNAHAQGNGTYHYHGPPNALFYSDTNIESPVVGFAADGFPIYGSYFDDGGSVRKATSSYQLKSGLRPSGDGEPGGSYDGTFRDDYEYVAGSGDLDECNGMTLNGVYGYYITEAYPYILACFTGTPDASFRK